MIKSLISDYQIDNVYLLDANFLVSSNIKFILMDLDNTLVTYQEDEPSKQCYQLFETLYHCGISVILISNNHKKRVAGFGKKLRVNYLSHTCKPFKFRLNSYMKKNGINKDETLLIGDQVINDMFLAKKLNLKSLLTNPLSTKDHISARIIRPLDRYLRKKYAKANRLGIILK